MKRGQNLPPTVIRKGRREGEREGREGRRRDKREERKRRREEDDSFGLFSLIFKTLNIITLIKKNFLKKKKDNSSIISLDLTVYHGRN